MKSRKTGRIVLIAACIIAVVIGFARKPSYIQVDDNTESSTYVYDEAGVLDSDAVNAVEDANSRMDATLYVVTVEDTGSYSTEEYCYNWQESHSLSQTSCELLIVTDDDSYWFIYGSSLAGVLDYSYGTLLDQYYVPYTDYSKAVEKFSDALADLFEESDYSAVGAAAEYSGNGGSVIAQILIAVVLIIIIIALVKAFTRRNYYWWGYNYPKPWYVPMWWWNRRPPHYRSYRPPRDDFPNGFYTPPGRNRYPDTRPSGEPSYRGRGFANPPPNHLDRGSHGGSSGFSGGGGSRSSGFSGGGGSRSSSGFHGGGGSRSSSGFHGGGSRSSGFHGGGGSRR